LESFAAHELQRYIRAISGAELPIVHEPQAAAGFALALGPTKAAAAAGFSLDQHALGRDGYAAQATEGGLVLVGRCPLGTLFGVYDLVEHEFGVRWCEPDEYSLYDGATGEIRRHSGDKIGEVIPRSESLRIGTFRRQFKPSFDYRWVQDGDWALKQRMNVWVAVEGKPVGLNLKWHYHTFCELIPPRECFDKHPEWFPLVKGKRVKSSQLHSHSTQLCTSNPEVVERLAERIIEVLSADPTIEMISLAPNDGGGWCECPNCKALDGPGGRGWFGSLSNRLGILNSQVAQRVARRHPKVLIKVGAYTYYLLPPDVPGFQVDPNLMIQIAHCYCCHNHPIGSGGCTVGTTYGPQSDFMPNERFVDVVKQWRAVTGNLFVYEYYALAAWGQAKSLWPMVHAMRHDIPWYRDQGFKGFFTQYVQTPWPRAPLNHYIAAKLAWNADLDVDWLIEDFCRGFFAESAGPMKLYLLGIEQAFARNNSCLSTAFNSRKPPARFAAEIFDRQTRDRLRAHLDEAARRAGDALVRRRIALVRSAFDDCQRVCETRP
jgi:hypothetical protein